MPYVVTDNCNGCKFTDCVAVCPADCFYELDKMVVIDPDECVECDKCVPACPVQAIYPDEDVPADLKQWIQYNATEVKRVKSEGAEPVTQSQDPMPGADERRAQLGF